MHSYIDEQKRICVVMEKKEAALVHDLLGQFYDSSSMELDSSGSEEIEGTCMQILKEGDYDDAMPGFEKDYEEVVDALYAVLDECIGDG